MDESKKRRCSAMKIGSSLAAGMALFLWSATAMAQGGSLAASETTIPGGTLVMVAYMVLWLMFGGYLFFIMRRQSKLQDELEGLERRIDNVLGTSEDVTS